MESMHGYGEDEGAGHIMMIVPSSFGGLGVSAGAHDDRCEVCGRCDEDDDGDEEEEDEDEEEEYQMSGFDSVLDRLVGAGLISEAERDRMLSAKAKLETSA